ncbi:MAG: Glyoxalase/bleomycin resistance protein/dioxygenase [Mucilaginibacter sp.]|nr:Glyoxalase/bleomycin resistance protein/dioxygenase [Mucilaginibacter sp.]
MKNYLGRVIILVNDYEATADFYSANFDFVRIFDVTTDVGQRFLHMGADQLSTLGIWFLKAEGKQQENLVGKQTGGQPTLVIYTDNLDELYQRVKSNNVKIKVEPISTPGYKFFHCFDLYGNEIIVAELQD